MKDRAIPAVEEDGWEGPIATNDCLSVGDCIAFAEARPGAPQTGRVHAHLDHCSACRVAVAEAAQTVATGSHRSGNRTLADGERLMDRYEIRRFIARGGMGEVYEAFDTVLRERVALKTLVLTSLDSAEAAELLLAEVRLARMVTHRNVCRILELGVHRRSGRRLEAVPFLTMEFLTGEPLGARVRRIGPLPLDQIWQITRDLAAGLAAVHAEGIVHRDFKSDNVFLVAAADGRDRAVVMDFGLARALDGRPTAMTSPGSSLAGTALYMAPEQIAGAPPAIGFDIYALGVVVFEMLTGRLPSPESSIGAVDPTWRDLIGRCLHPEPSRRPASALHLAAALEEMQKPPRPRRGRSPIWIAMSVGSLLATVPLVTMFGRNNAGISSPAPPHVAEAPAISPQTVPPPPASVRVLARPDQDRTATPRRSRKPRTRSIVQTSPSHPPPPIAAPPPTIGQPAARQRHPDDLDDPFDDGLQKRSLP